jgi:hypothetical protein
MTHDVTIENNTGTTVNLHLLQFFTRVEGSQVARILDGGSYEFQAECYPAQSIRKLRTFCSDSGFAYGKTGLLAVMTDIEPAAE